MAACKPDIMSIDQHVDMRDAIQRIGPDFAVQVWLCAGTALMQAAGWIYDHNEPIPCGDTLETNCTDYCTQPLQFWCGAAL